MNRNSAIVCGAAAILMGVCGTAFGAPYVGGNEPLTFASLQSGQFELQGPATLARGEGASFDNVTIWVPLVLDEFDSFNNSPVAGFVDGVPTGVVTLWTSRATDESGFHDQPEAAGARGLILTLGGGCQFPNNIILDESVAGGESFSPFADFTNAPGTLTEDGFYSIRANFTSLANSVVGDTQNNIEFTNIADKLPGDTVAATGSLDKIFNPNTDIDGGSGGFGSVFLSSPSLLTASENEMFLAQANFNGGFGDLVDSGVNVWSFDPNGSFPQIETDEAFVTWLQDDFLVPSLCENDVSAARRNSSPFLFQLDVQCPNGGSNTGLYVAFGNGISGGSLPTGSDCEEAGFSGGSALPINFVIDSVDTGGSSDGFADGAVYLTPNGLSPLDGDPNQNFVDHQGTGGGSANTSHMFDVNSSGQLVIVRENDNDPINTWQVLLYTPEFDEDTCEFLGYGDPQVIVSSNETLDNGTTIVVPEDQFETGGDVITDLLIPFSGVSIDEDGLIAFVAATEFFTVENDGLLELANTTNTLFAYDTNTDTLHEILKGGQNGTEIPVRSCSDTDGVAVVDSIIPGFFPLDISSDSFSGEGLSDTGRVIAVSFRNGDEGATDTDGDGFDDNGGVINLAGGGEVSVNGVLLVSLGDLTTAPTDVVGDANGDGNVDSTDLNLVLGIFGCMMDCGDADLSGDGMVNSTDLNLVLGNFGFMS